MLRNGKSEEENRKRETTTKRPRVCVFLGEFAKTIQKKNKKQCVCKMQFTSRTQEREVKRNRKKGGDAIQYGAGWGVHVMKRESKWKRPEQKDGKT